MNLASMQTLFSIKQLRLVQILIRMQLLSIASVASKPGKCSIKFASGYAFGLILEVCVKEKYEDLAIFPFNPFKIRVRFWSDWR